jgi:hypothetical protein
MADILSDMNVSVRKFIREFPLFRDKAQRGETVLVEARGGMKFVFCAIGQLKHPAQSKTPLPQSVTAAWNVEDQALNSNDWEMNDAAR